jgi:hypothetical protein
MKKHKKNRLGTIGLSLLTLFIVFVSIYFILPAQSVKALQDCQSTGGVDCCPPPYDLLYNWKGAGCPGDVCRSSTAACDPTEFVTTTQTCPTDINNCAPPPSCTVGAVCRASTNAACDPAEVYDSSCNCPANVNNCGSGTPGALCRGSAGSCDIAEYYDSSGNCPSDTFSSGICRASTNISCDPAETCTGTSASCPIDTNNCGGGTPYAMCRPSAGACDPPEYNDASGNCPSNSYSPNGTSCRPSAGICDLAEVCSGSSPTCPFDFVQSSATQCRASTNTTCDPVENCTGDTALCSTDINNCVASPGCSGQIQGGPYAGGNCNMFTLRSTCVGNSYSVGCSWQAPVSTVNVTLNGSHSQLFLSLNQSFTFGWSSAWVSGCDLRKNAISYSGVEGFSAAPWAIDPTSPLYPPPGSTYTLGVWCTGVDANGATNPSNIVGDALVVTGAPLTSAIFSVTNNCPLSNWTVAPGNYTGVNGSSGGPYTLTFPLGTTVNEVLGIDSSSPAYSTPVVTNSDGTGSSLVLGAANNKGFNILCSLKTPTAAPLTSTPGTTYACSDGGVTINWSGITNSSSCVGIGTGWSGSKSIPSGSQFIPYPNGLTFALQCNNYGLATTTTAYITPTGPTSATCTAEANKPVFSTPLTASPTSGIQSVVNPQLSWNVTYGAGDLPTCMATGDWSGTKGVTGSGVAQGVLGTVKTYSYTLTCTNSYGSAASTATVVVSAAPKANLTIAATTASTVTPQAGVPLTFSATVSNSGAASTVTSFNNFYQVATAASGGGTLSSASVNSLAAITNGGTGSITSSSYTFPSSGTYSVRTCADNDGSLPASATQTAAGTIVETSDADNCSPWLNLTVAVAPTAQITVSSNNSLGTWTITPSGLTGSGLGPTNHTVSPAVTVGTAYSITPGAITNYTSSVSPPGPTTVFQGGAQSFTITYTGATFVYTISPISSLSIVRGSSDFVTFPINYVSGLAAPVSIDASGAGIPTYITFTKTAPCTPAVSPVCSGTLTFTVKPTTPAGTYPITISATDGVTTKTSPFSVIATDPSALSVTLTSSPSSPQVGTPVIWTATPLGGIGPYTFTWTLTDVTGTPITNSAGASNYNKAYQTPGIKTAKVTVTDGVSTSASSVVSVIQVGLLPKYIEF